MTTHRSLLLSMSPVITIRGMAAERFLLRSSAHVCPIDIRAVPVRSDRRIGGARRHHPTGQAHPIGVHRTDPTGGVDARTTHRPPGPRRATGEPDPPTAGRCSGSAGSHDPLTVHVKPAI